MIKHLRWPLLAAAAVIGMAALNWLLPTDQGPPNAVFAMNAQTFGPSDYAGMLETSNRRLMNAHARAERTPDEWLPRAGVAAAALAQFRLTGSIDYLEQAKREAALVRQLAPSPSGVPELRAQIAMAQHDLATARRELDELDRASVAPDQATLSEATAMRGDLALYSGRHDEAGRLYREAARIAPDIGIAMRVANLRQIAGQFDAALVELARATRAQRHTPAVLSSIALRAGMIESARGDYAAAQGWYDRAETLFPGHWLTGLYRAEAQIANGAADAGVAALETIARDHARPEAMDMLALVWRTRGDSQRSRAWAAQANAIWRAWSEQHRSAFAAHAAEHELVFGDPQRALELARLNLRNRPFGEARLLLARALLANNHPNEALTQIESAQRTGWRSAQLFTIKAQALAILGNADAAIDARDDALALNPKINDAATRLIWLAHG